VAAADKVVHYFDIPIQHINNKILKAMHRPDTKKRICDTLYKLRARIPDSILRTTVIVGFPGETDSQFAELLEFIRDVRFEALGCFKYYAESGTPAAQMPGQIPEDIKDQRVQQLMLAQQEIAFENNQQKIGSELTCLIDSFETDGTVSARYYGQAPEIDSVCILNRCFVHPGSFIKAKVTGVKDYDLLIEQI
jgi:ribosomal protein S12 methylthiotransferase